MEQEKNDKGHFLKKGNSERKVRTIRLTDETWDKLGEKADENHMSKADLIEALANNEIRWNEDEEIESSLDFDVDEVAEILKEILKFKSREGTKMKDKIKEVLEIMGVDLDEDD